MRDTTIPPGRPPVKVVVGQNAARPAATQRLFPPVKPPLASSARLVDIPPAPQERPAMERLNPAAKSALLSQLAEKMSERVIGHEANIAELIQCITKARAGIASAKKPIGAYLLVGPTGSGKTLAVQALAEEVTGMPNAMIRIDCGEYQHSHEVAKLIGAPPGYLGHRETPALLSTQAVNRQTGANNQISFLLFDEVDKAHDKLLDILLGILDTGSVTLGDNSRTDLHNTLVLMTANSGAREMQEALRPTFGLGVGMPTGTESQRADAIAEAQAKKALRPEFYNRLDCILVFHQLTEEQIGRVLSLELADLEKRMLESKQIGLSVSDAARKLIAADGYDPRYGARHLKRNLERLLVSPLAALITSGQAKSGTVVRVETETGEDGAERLVYYG